MFTSAALYNAATLSTSAGDVRDGSWNEASTALLLGGALG